MRFAEFSRRCQPEAAVAQPIFQRKDHKGPGCSLGPLCINILKLSGLSQPKVFGKRVRPDCRLRRRQDLIMLNSDTLAALVSSRFKHETATTCFHSGPESMCFRAAAIVRLVCPLWHSCAPWKT